MTSNETHTPRPQRKKRVAAGMASASGLSAIIVWIWGISVPEHPMPPEVAGAFAGLLGTLIGAICNR